MTNCYVSGSRKENPRLVYLALALSIKILVSWKADGGSYTVPLVQFDQGSVSHVPDVGYGDWMCGRILVKEGSAMPPYKMPPAP